MIKRIGQGRLLKQNIGVDHKIQLALAFLRKQWGPMETRLRLSQAISIVKLEEASGVKHGDSLLLK